MSTADPWEIAWVAIAFTGFCGNMWCYRTAVQDRDAVVDAMRRRAFRDPTSKEFGVSSLILADGTVAQERLRLIQQAFFLTVGVGACFLSSSPPRLDMTPGQAALIGLVRLSFFVPVVLASMASWMRLRVRKRLDEIALGEE